MQKSATNKNVEKITKTPVNAGVFYHKITKDIECHILIVYNKNALGISSAGYNNLSKMSDMTKTISNQFGLEGRDIHK